MTTRLLSVVVPVYCNEGSLRELHRRLQDVALKLCDVEVSCEFIYVDDGSRDKSFDILQEIAHADNRVSLVRLSRNFGANHCSKRGLDLVRGGAFVILAADLQEPPELILELVARWSKGSRFVICERASRGDPWPTRLFAWLFYRLLRGLVVPDFPKGGFDLALMDSCMLETIRTSSKTTYIPILAYWMGFTPDVITYHRESRVHGVSKWTIAKKVNALIDVFTGFSVKPLRAIALVGLLVAGVSMAYSIVVVVSAFAGRIDSPGFPTLVALVSFLSGLQLITLGVIGEYLWRVLDQVNHRPESVVAFQFLRDEGIEQ